MDLIREGVGCTRGVLPATVAKLRMRFATAIGRLIAGTSPKAVDWTIRGNIAMLDVGVGFVLATAFSIHRGFPQMVYP